MSPAALDASKQAPDVGRTKAALDASQAAQRLVDDAAEAEGMEGMVEGSQGSGHVVAVLRQPRHVVCGDRGRLSGLRIYAELQEKAGASESPSRASASLSRPGHWLTSPVKRQETCCRVAQWQRGPAEKLMPA